MASRLGLEAKNAVIHGSRSFRGPIASKFTKAHPIQIRAFLGTPALTKKKTHKEDHRHGKYNPQDLQNDPPKQNDAPNAFDFAALEREILKSIERMTHRLAELRSGGRLSPSTIEVLPVKLDKESSSTVKIKDLAQVVSKGQYMHIILNDEAHIKLVRSAIQSSNLSLTPQGPTSESPTTLTIKIPPQTGESRQAVIHEVKSASQKALDDIKKARHTKHDALRTWKVEKTLRSDDYQKAHDEMEKVVKRGNEEVKRLADGARKVFEG